MNELPILYRDDGLVVVDKPSGWVVHHGMTRDAIACVDVLGQQLGARVWPVHRLDRGTSGVLLFALHVDAARALQALFVDGVVRKRYWAIVRGAPPPEGLIDHPVPKDEGGELVAAQTRYRTLETIELAARVDRRNPESERRQRYSTVAAEPLTGRFHQIRRHLKHLGHPLIGDANYGRREHNRVWAERFGLARLALHAESIELDWRGQRLRVEAPRAIGLDRAWMDATRAAGQRRTEAIPPGG